MLRTTALTITLLLLFAAACGGGSDETTQASSGASTLPQGSEPVKVTVTEDTRTISGIEARVVHDVVTEDGQLVEDTYD